jgi:hypothetical protein
MEHFVTLLDSLFIPQVIALNYSMERKINNYKLWILCIDNKSFDFFKKINLKNVNLLKFTELETPELRSVKKNRTSGEYCWTITPIAPSFVFKADESVERVTYIDADMWFLKNPEPIFSEFEKSGKSVLITDHGYAPEFDLSATSGQYCVQFIIFKKNESENVRQWWEDRCLEWCYCRYEDDKFGDQKYLDDWTSRFKEKVHVLQQKEWMLAPWNATRFPYGTGILHHFHGVRLINNEKCLMPSYPIPDITIKYLYRQYFLDIKKSIQLMIDNEMQPLPQTIPQYESLIINIKNMVSKFILNKNKNRIYKEMRL